MQQGFNEAELRQLYADAAAAPGVVKEELSRGVRAGGEKVKRAVQRGFSWSTKVPEKVHLSVQESGVSPRAQVTVDDSTGEAAAVNNQDKPGTFRHPVYGNRKNWASQVARPSFRTYAIPAAQEAEKDITDAMERAAHRLGFH